jgi:predicted transposase YbfD/YdcC
MRQRHTAESPTVETHDYLCSSRAGATELGRLIRSHWPVENQCYNLLDVLYHEDHCQVRDITAKWTKPPASWVAAASQFAIQFGSRFF